MNTLSYQLKERESKLKQSENVIEQREQTEENLKIELSQNLRRI